MLTKAFGFRSTVNLLDASVKAITPMMKGEEASDDEIFEEFIQIAVDQGLIPPDWEKHFGASQE
jgi:hypothetical protein